MLRNPNITPTPELADELLEEIHVAAGRIVCAMEDRDFAIQRAYQANVPVNTIAAVAGITRQRVHQIVSA